MILLRKAENHKAEFKRPKFQKAEISKGQKTHKAENSLGRKYGRKIGTRTYFSAIFSHLNNNWDI